MIILKVQIGNFTIDTHMKKKRRYLKVAYDGGVFYTISLKKAHQVRDEHPNSKLMLCYRW